MGEAALPAACPLPCTPASQLLRTAWVARVRKRGVQLADAEVQRPPDARGRCERGEGLRMCTALSDRLWKQQSHVAGKGEPALGEHPPRPAGTGKKGWQPKTHV